MSPVIDLTPYLPQQQSVTRRSRRKRFGSLTAALEAAVTLCMGAGLLLVLAALLSSLLL